MTDFAAFADGLLYDMLSLSPDLAEELGLGEVGGRPLPQAAMIDLSDEGADARRRMMAGRAQAFQRFGLEDVRPDERTTWRVVDYLLSEGGFGCFAGWAGRAFAETPHPFNHLTGGHAVVTMMLARDHAAGDAAGAEAYLERLSAVPGAIADLIAAARGREAEGYRTPAAVLSRTLADVVAFAEAPPEQNLFVTSLADKLGPRAASDQGRAWLAAAQAIVAGGVIPAYRRLAAAIEAQLAHGPSDDGYWSLPDGEAHYAWLLRTQTTTGYTPQAVHEIGLEEIARVHAQITAQFAEIGIRGEDVASLYGQISGPDYLAPRMAGSRAEALGYARDLMAGLEAAAAPLFVRLPRQGVEVELVAPEFEDSQHTRYTPPAPDKGRPGLFSLNLKVAGQRPGWEFPVLCAHEATPGHHTQLALAQELDLPPLRRAVVFTAYIEGWAKYAETLLDHHLADDPYIRLGRLRGELYSSVNLALDTGLHALRWSRTQARDFFQAQTGVARDFADIIVDRSLAAPAQMCAYKIGLIEMRRLRDDFTAGQGEAALPAFHEAVLGQGALPLQVLADVVGAASTTQHAKAT